MKWCSPSDYVGEEAVAPEVPPAAPPYQVRTWSFPAPAAREPVLLDVNVEEERTRGCSGDLRLQGWLVVSLVLITFASAAILFLEPSWPTRLAAVMILVLSLAGLTSQAALQGRSKGSPHALKHHS